MDIRESKFEVGIVVLTLIAAVGFFRAFSGPAEPKDLVLDISYEMPRPKSDIVGEFGLGDREIDRRYVNPFEGKAAAAAGKPSGPQGKAAPPVKKAPTRTAAANAAAVEARRRLEHQYRVIAKQAMGFAHDSMNATPPPSPEAVTSAAAAAGPTNEEKKDEDKLSSAQWRSLLSGQPTKENMDKLLAAIAKGDAEEKVLLEIVEEFLKGQNQGKHSVALYGLSKHASARSFVFIAKLEPTLTADVAGGVKAYLDGYSASSRHPALLGALQSSDRVVALRAAGVVKAGVSSGNPVPNPNPDRVTPQSQTAWSRFTSIFQRWALSGDADMQSLAASILPFLQPARA